MLEAFVSELRRTAPLARSNDGMGNLLSAVSTGLAPMPRLPRRAGDYTRTRVYGDDRFEVLLLDWAPGSASPIHDHGGQHCWLAVVEGAIRIDDYRRLDCGETPERAQLETTGWFELSSGGLDLRSGTYDIHRVSAIGHAVTLHVYAAPLEAFSIYDQRAQRCRSAAGTYDCVLSATEFAPAG